MESAGDTRNPNQERHSLWTGGLLRIGLVIGLFSLVWGVYVLWNSSPPLGSASNGATSSQQTSTDPANLLPFSSFETDNQRLGIADGLKVWGSSSFSLVTTPVIDGRLAQRVDVTPDKQGGAWFEVPARAGTTYTQSVYLRVLALGPGAQVDLILEWYNASEGLLGYEMDPIGSVDSHYIRRSQTATAPLHTVRVRFVVNIAGGGAYVMDAPELNIGTVASSYRANPIPDPAKR
jgi:hypothetical protein